jgi:NAD(P)-dependent dehydrogenase (short-subunit alcohol dehydrogenase family)
MNDGAGSEGDLSGKVCLVTGATSGIGKETARGLAARGATVLVGGRDEHSAAGAAAEIGAAAGNRNVEPAPADLSSQAEVRKLAADVAGRHGRLDVLVNNAALMVPERRLTADGLELIFATNYLAPFLLTNLLTDVLRRSAPARVVSLVTPQYGSKIDWNDLQGARKFAMQRQNSASKLALAMFTFELARRLEGSGMTANCVFPGFVDTGHNFPGYLGLLYKYGKPFLKTPSRGAVGPLYLATSASVANISGAYFSGTKQRKPAPAARDKAAWSRLWDVSTALTHLDGAAPAA